MLTEARRRWRARQLAGDARAGVWARAEARRLQRAFVRRQWRLLAAAVVTVLLVAGTVVYFMPDAFLRGLIIGAAAAGTPLALAMLVMQVTGTAATTMGATAEQWTADELRPLRNDGWRVVNHISLHARADIDHVLVGPLGVLVVETKWSARGWSVDPPEQRVIGAVEQARRNAKTVRLWQPVRTVDATVESVVFLWGGNANRHASDGDDLPQIGGVTIVTGSAAARQWRAGIEHRSTQRRIDDAGVDQIWRALDHHARRRDEYEHRTAPIPRALSTVFVAATVLVAAGVVSFLLDFRLLTALNSIWTWAAVNVPLLALSYAARRAARLRLIATATLTGLSAALLLAAVTAVYAAATA